MTKRLGIAVDLAERAAVLAIDGGLDSADSERQALRELLDELVRHRRPLQGVTNEIFEAASWCWHPEIAPALANAGLLGRRAPAWGVGNIITDRGRYRPALRGELGSPAI